MKRCLRCVLPECTPGVDFADGICSDCRGHQPIVYQGEDKLLALLDSCRRSGGHYHCAVNLSGGRDSSYALLKLVRDYGMKVLAINCQNPFTDPQAQKNIDNAVRTLGVDLVQFQLPNSLHERTFRDTATAWLRNPSPALVPMICMACKTMHAPLIRIARRHGAPCMVNGGNRFEDVSFKKRLLGVEGSVSPEHAVTTALAGLVKESWRHRSYFKAYMLPTLLKGYLFADPYTVGSRLLGRTMKRIDLFYFIPWQEETILSRLRSELAWDAPPDARSTWRFDCRIGLLKDWMYRTTLGITEHDEFYSRMIRDGAMSRETALQRLEHESARGTERVVRFLEENGIDPNLLRNAERIFEGRRPAAGV